MVGEIINESLVNHVVNLFPIIVVPPDAYKSRWTCVIVRLKHDVASLIPEMRSVQQTKGEPI